MLDVLEIYVNGELILPTSGEVKFPTSGGVNSPGERTGGEARSSHTAQRLAAQCAAAMSAAVMRGVRGETNKLWMSGDRGGIAALWRSPTSPRLWNDRRRGQRSLGTDVLGHELGVLT